MWTWSREPGWQHAGKGCPSRLFAAETSGGLLCESGEMEYMASGSETIKLSFTLQVDVINCTDRMLCQ